MLEAETRQGLVVLDWAQQCPSTDEATQDLMGHLSLPHLLVPAVTEIQAQKCVRLLSIFQKGKEMSNISIQKYRILLCLVDLMKMVPPSSWSELVETEKEDIPHQKR
jgi:hypothetical protein